MTSGHQSARVDGRKQKIFQIVTYVDIFDSQEPRQDRPHALKRQILNIQEFRPGCITGWSGHN